MVRDHILKDFGVPDPIYNDCMVRDPISNEFNRVQGHISHDCWVPDHISTAGVRNDQLGNLPQLGIF